MLIPLLFVVPCVHRLGGVYPKHHADKEELFLAFAPRALKLNTMLAQGGVDATEAVGVGGSKYLANVAAAAERKRAPFQQVGGGWPAPHGQPWDQREQVGLANAKPWDATKRTVAEMRALRNEEADDPLQPLWW